MSDYSELIRTIIKKIQEITGPVAVTQANKVPGLKTNGKTTIKGNPQRVLNELMNKYETIMGPVAVTLAKKSITSILKENPELKVPKELK